MKLPISSLKEGLNEFHFSSVSDGWIKEIMHRVDKRGYRLQEILELQAEVTKLEPDFLLGGRLIFRIEQSCARCAESFVLPISHDFKIAFTRRTPTQGGGGPIQEADVNLFMGNELDISPTVEEQMILSIPYAALCRPDCKGICQKCGQNLNGSRCSCETQVLESPLAVLKNLRVQ